MKTSKIVEKSKEKTKRQKTKHLSVRVNEHIIEWINLLVELGLFKDKSDFVNFSLQETLRNYLTKIKFEVTPDLIDKYFSTLEKVSPNIPEKETVQLLKEIRLRRK